jgi:hypothetical protein
MSFADQGSQQTIGRNLEKLVPGEYDLFRLAYSLSYYYSRASHARRRGRREESTIVTRDSRLRVRARWSREYDKTLEPSLYSLGHR